LPGAGSWLDYPGEAALACGGDGQSPTSFRSAISLSSCHSPSRPAKHGRRGVESMWPISRQRRGH